MTTVRALVLAVAFAACGATAFAAPARAHERNDYADRTFDARLEAGLHHFYARDFAAAQNDFERALAVVPGNTFALSFLNATAAQRGTLDALTAKEEDAAAAAPTYGNHVALALSYLFESLAGRERTQDARDELGAALALDRSAAGAHVALGIMRFNERSANRSKTEFLSALQADPDDVLAREYLAQLYQTDLRDPRRGLVYAIDVPNLVPGYADIDFHIGSLLHDLHQPELALRYLKAGLALDVGRAGEAGQHGATLVARIYIEEHRLPEARAVLGQAVSDGVDTIYASTLLAKIKNGEYAAPSPSPGPEKR